MKLVFIYGPPAVGKLTVANELSKITGFKVFSNHFTMDFISYIFKFGTNTFWKEHMKLRNLLFDIIVHHDINSIYTFVYTGKEDDKTISNISKLIKGSEGKIYFVRLVSKKEVLEKRVIGKSRKKFGKLTTLSGLRHSLRKDNFYQEAPFEPQITIDNSNLSAKKTASIIKKSYKL